MELKLNLIDLYKSIVSAAGLVADDEGYISTNQELFTGDENTPAMIGDKRMVLPTDEHLKTPSDTKIIIHPLKEQAFKGESEVFIKLKTALTVRLNFTMAALTNALLDIAKKVEIHKTLSPDQAQLLVVGKSITDKTHITFSEVMLKSVANPEHSFVHIFMKKSGVVDNVSFRRVAVVTFPIYEELCKEQDKYFGMTIKPAERDNLKALMEYILPGIETPGKFNRGSNSNVAPYMDSLMASFGSVAAYFNEKLELFNKFIPEADILTINSEWVEVFEDLDAHRTMIHMVPQQAGNEGSFQAPTTPAMVPMPAAQPAPAASAAPRPITATPQQQHYPQNQQQGQTGPRSFADMVRASPHLQQYAQGMQVQQGYAPPPGAPRGNWGGAPQPMYPGQYPGMGYQPTWVNGYGMPPRSIV